MPRKSSRTCGRGHPLEGANLKIYPDGKRQCRECFNAAVRNRRQRLRAEHLGRPLPEPARPSDRGQKKRCACGRELKARSLPGHQRQCLPAICAELGLTLPDFHDIIRNLSSSAASRGNYR